MCRTSAGQAEGGWEQAVQQAGIPAASEDYHDKGKLFQQKRVRQVFLLLTSLHAVSKAGPSKPPAGWATG